MKKLFAAFITLATAVSLAFGGSTINPSVPITNSPLSSAPLRANFQAAYSDINSILGKFAGVTPPLNPANYQYWVDTSTSPFALRIYDGALWVSTGVLNPTTHIWSSTGSYAGPIIAVPQGGTGIGTLTGLAFGNGTSAMSAYAGTGCTSQFVRNLDASGVATCATVANTDLSNSSLTLGSTNVSLGATAASITNLALIAPALGTPASGVATNLTGTAASLTAGNVTTNANLTGPITSVGNATSIGAQTGTGSTFVMQTNPVLTGPTLGVALATSINGNLISTGTGTLTLGPSKTLTANNTLTLVGTDGTTVTFPSTSATVARTDAANTFTGAQTVSNAVVTGGTIDGVTIGAATAAAVTGTTISATSKHLSADGVFNAPGYAFTSESTTGMYRAGAGVVRITTAGADAFQVNSSGLRVFSDSGSIQIGATGSTSVVWIRDGSNVASQRNGTNAQIYRFYNTYTDGSNYERVGLNWASNLFSLNTEAAGTGTQRALGLQTAGGRVLIGTTTDDATNMLQVTGNVKITGTLNATTALQINGNPVTAALSGTTGSIGGGALVAGACTSGTVTITGATTAMVPVASPVTYPGDGFDWISYVSSSNTVTVKVCGLIAGTPTASNYNVRIVQ